MSRRLFYTIALFLFVSKLAASTPTTCMTVVEDLAYCLGYMLGSREVSPACCVGVKSLSEEAKTKENRQSICECATKLLAVYPYDAKRLTELPEKCGVKMAMPPIDKVMIVPRSQLIEDGALNYLLAKIIHLLL